MPDKNNSQVASNDEIDLSRMLGALFLYKWLIIGVTSIFAIIGVNIILFTTPIYLANALVQVEQNVGNTLLNNLSQILPDSQPQSAAEIELMRSRMVIGKTVDELNLDTKIEPKYFPIIGKGLARLNNVIPPEVSVSRFNVPAELYDQKLVLHIINDKQYLLKNSDDDVLLQGRIGELAKNNGITILITDHSATNDSDFYITKHERLKAIDDLLDDFNVADKGKDTGVLGLTLLGENPKEIKLILNKITQNYLEQNVARKSEEAGKSLDFLREQLPEVRKTLDVSEDKLNLFRQQNDSVDLSLEAKSVLDTMVATQTQLNQLTFAEAEISKLFTKDHPTYKALLEKRKTLEDEKASLDKQISSMPKTQQEILRLTRDAQSNQEIYMQLLNKQQELSITKASTVGNVRIVDSAESQSKPVKPKKIVVIIFSTILGFIVSVTFALIRTALHKGIESAEQLEAVGINVYAGIPVSEWQIRRDKELKFINRKSKKNERVLVSIDNPADLAVEALRSLRTSLHFAMLGAKNNLLMISGASPGIGKTFVSANLATVIAQAGLRVLLIDCDMRRGYAHELMNTKPTPGFSDLISEQIDIEGAIVKTKVENLDFISRGQVPPNPSELLMRPNLGLVLDKLNSRYDIVIIDTPPILAVTDAAIIGKYAATQLIVARFEQSSIKEIQVAIKRFEQNGINVKGVILNAVIRQKAGYYGYGENYYSYEYKSEKDV